VAEPTVTVSIAEHRAAQRFTDSILAIADGIDPADCSEIRIAVGEASVGLRFASASLERQFAPAFRHLAGNLAGTDLSVTLWDASTEAPAVPRLPWPIEAYRPCGEVAGYSDGPCYLHFDAPMSALTVFDTKRGTAAYISRKSTALPKYEIAGPLRSLIHRFGVDRGMALVHAGAVARSNLAALITGPKGTGKSTTVLSCVAAGFDYLGDDRCLLTAGGEPRVHSVYSSAKIFVDELDRYPIAGLREAALPPGPTDNGKGLIYVDRIAPASVARSARLHCIISPVPVGGRRSKLVRRSGSEALRLLIAEIVGHSPVTAAQSLALLKQICASVPFYRLEAGRHLPEVAATIARSLESA
jgi:hypothetical protein